MKKRILHIIIGILGVAACLSCQDSLLYSQHMSTNDCVWGKHDTLTFEMPPTVKAGDYEMLISMRVTEDYEYKDAGFVLVTECDSAFVSRDTLRMPLFGNDGRPLGVGFPYIYNEMSIDTIRIEKDRSYTFKMWHVMRRFSLVGINDVGVTLRKI